MRIEECTLTDASEIGDAAGDQETARSGRDAAGGAGGSGSGYRGELSSTLAVLSRAMASDRAMRNARVQALSRSYRSGSYRPDGAASSRSMVSEALAGE